MITVRDLGEFPRVYREDEGETMVEMIEVMNDKEVNSDNEDKDKNLCVLNGEKQIVVNLKVVRYLLWNVNKKRL